MPGTTINGLPYPTGTDRLTDGAAKIQQLAEASDLKTLAAWTLWPAVWSASTTNPNKGSTGICDFQYLKRGHTVEFNLKLLLQGSGVNLGVGNYSWALPFPPTDWDRWAFSGQSTGPNRQFTGRFTNSPNLVVFANGGTSIFGNTEAAAQGWAAGTLMSVSGSYTTNA